MFLIEMFINKVNISILKVTSKKENKWPCKGKENMIDRK